jgi:hypothetical protein
VVVGQPYGERPAVGVWPGVAEGLDGWESHAVNGFLGTRVVRRWHVVAMLRFFVHSHT